MPYKLKSLCRSRMWMPVYWSTAVAQELRLDAGQKAHPDAPLIIEEQMRQYSDRIQVTVIWDRWSQDRCLKIEAALSCRSL